MLRLARKILELNLDAVRRHRERRAGMRTTATAWQVLEQEAVFVLSTGRCGTELLTRVFERAPSVMALHRPDPELAYPSVVAYQCARTGGDPEIIEKMFVAGRFELLLESLVRGRRYIETNNRITFFAPAIASLMPNARFIHLVREPEGFVRSGVRRGYYSGGLGDLSRIMPTSGGDAGDWPNLSTIGRCAWLWAETNRYILEFQRTIDRPDRFISVKSTDLYSQPSEVERILRFAGLDTLEEESVSKLLVRKVNEQLDGPDPGPITSWSVEDKAQFHLFVGRARDMLDGSGGGRPNGSEDE